jgi:hypothetical protein
MKSYRGGDINAETMGGDRTGTFALERVEG